MYSSLANRDGGEIIAARPSRTRNVQKHIPNISLPEILKKWRNDILDHWLKEQLAAVGMRRDLIKEDELRQQSAEFLQRFTTAAQSGGFGDVKTRAWAPVTELLGDLSRTRGRMGFSPSETATFVFSLKQPLFTRLLGEIGNDSARLFEEVALVNQRWPGAWLDLHHRTPPFDS